MRTKILLQELIALADAYDATVPENENLSMDDFIFFLNRNNAKPSDDMLLVDIAKNISLLHRYSKFYLKKVLKGTLLQTVDEYSYLICLYYNTSYTKTELNNMNAMEKTSGNEVIRRLLNSQLVKEQQDPSDKRSMRISITEMGKAEIEKIFPGLSKVAIILSGAITDGEKAVLNKSLDSLCDYHHAVFTGQKNSTIDDILNKMPV